MRIEFDISGAGPMVRAPESSTETKAGAPPLQFDLPRSLLAALAATSAGYLAVMGLAFRAGAGIGIIFAIFGVALVAYYGLPMIMMHSSGGALKDEDVSRRRGAWGIDTASGYLPGRAACAQIMTVPLLMLAWALFIAVLH